MDLNLILAKDMDRSDVSDLFRTIKEKQEGLWLQLTTELRSENSPGIRQDVLQYLADNADYVLHDRDFVYHIAHFAHNISLGREWYEWMLDYFTTEDPITIQDFSMIISEASERNLSLPELQEIFRKCGKNINLILNNITGEGTDERDGSADTDSETDERNEPVETEEEAEDREKTVAVVESNKADDNYIGLFDDMLTAVSLGRKPDSSVSGVQDSFSKLFEAAQKVISEISTCSTETLRSWEKDREEIERLRGLYSMLQRILERQTQTINDLRAENYRLQNELELNRQYDHRREEINQKIAELGKLVGTSERNHLLGMITEEAS